MDQFHYTKEHPSNLIVLEILSFHSPLEHDIQFLICPTLHLRDPKPTPDQARYAQPAKEEPELSPQSGLIGVDKIWYRDRHDNTDDGLDGSRNGDGLGAHAGGGNFAEDGVSHGSDTRMD